MLDTTKQGLCQPQMIERFVAHIEPEGRANAKRVLELGVRVRDAFAHGALVRMPEYDRKGLAQILFKSMQLLMVSGLYFLVENAAYFNWENNRASQHGYDIDDWKIAERQIYELVQSYNSARRIEEYYKRR